MVFVVKPQLLELPTHAEPLPINVTRPSVTLRSTVVKVSVLGPILIALVQAMVANYVTVTQPVDNVPFLTDPTAHQLIVPMVNGLLSLYALSPVGVETSPEPEVSTDLKPMVEQIVHLLVPLKLSHVTPNAVLKLVPSTNGEVSELAPKSVVVDPKTVLVQPTLPPVMVPLVMDPLLILLTVTLNVVLSIVPGAVGVAMMVVPRLVVVVLKPEPDPKLLKFVVVILVMASPLKPETVTPTIVQSLVLVHGPNGVAPVHVMELL